MIHTIADKHTHTVVSGHAYSTLDVYKRQGLGFTIALLMIGSIREILGAGTWFGLQVLPESVSPIAMFSLPPGGFLTFGFVVALAN